MVENEREPDPLAARKALTFAQAEGLEPLPSQLARGQISQEFRAVLWLSLKHEFGEHRVDSPLGGGYLRKPWSTILEEAQVYHHNQLSEFPLHFREAIDTVKRLVEKGTWSDVLGWLEFVLKHPACPRGFPRTIDAITARCHLAYRVFDGKVICPPLILSAKRLKEPSRIYGDRVQRCEDASPECSPRTLGWQLCGQRERKHPCG